MTRNRLERFGPPIVLAVVLGYLGWAMLLPRFRSATSHDVVIELSVRVDGYEIDSEINQRLAGETQVTELLQNAAACRNGTDWMSDVAVGTDVLVSTDPGLIRAAELTLGDDYEAELVRAVEQLLIDGVDDAGIVADLAGDWDADSVSNYLEARSHEPSTEAQRRFVGFATRESILGDAVRVIDTHALNESAVEAFAGRRVHAWVYVAGTDDEARSIPASACRAVLAELNG